METPETPNFGLARVGAGESLAKHGNQALDADRVTLDALLHALEMHTHDAAPRLADPEELSPVLTTGTSGGQLPGGTTFYYTVSLIDRWGLETASCTEVSVTTPQALAVDGAPGLSTYSGGGSLGTGQYSYVYTYVSTTGGETTPSRASSVRVLAGSTNRVEVDIPDLPSGAYQAKVYRSKDGQSQFFLVGIHDGVADYFTDTGASIDYTTVAPRTNTTGGTNTVTISVAGWASTWWEDAFGWRIYRALAPGEYGPTSLVHEVVETEDEDTAVLRKTWVDDGDELESGTPRTVSATVSGGAVVDMGAVSGQLPLSAMPRGIRCLTFGGPVTGTMFDGSSDFPQIYLPQAIKPVALQLSTTGVAGRTGDPVDLTLNSTGGTTVGDPVKVTLDDESGLYLTTWPLVDTVKTQAEDMVRSSTAVLAVSDLNASSGMALELDAQNEYVEATINLEPGLWKLRVRHRYTGTRNDTDLHYVFLNGATVLHDVAFAGATSVSAAYTTVTPAIAGGGVDWAGGPLKVRIKKSATTVVTHVLDWVELYTEVPEIPAGQASIEYTPPGAGNVGTHHVYTLWF